MATNTMPSLRERMTLNAEEAEAVYEKITNPENKVICPRCGNELAYFPVGNSIRIECATPNCIVSGLRGI
ncbi:MAG: hypothetical protein LBT21_04355 [Oscillospiraceae bacterium]|jgi:hypothetical protein|nr:hypothetical protein [Oscillospiraceae bacterium]